MEESTIWWLAAGAVVVAELLTGTFYLLMVAIGLVAAALAAHLGLPITAQIVAAAVVGGGAGVPPGQPSTVPESPPPRACTGLLNWWAIACW